MQMDMWKSLDKFCSEVIDSSSDDESEKKTPTMAVAASILHKHNASQMPVYRGSVNGISKNLSRDKVGGHLRLYEDYFDRTNPVFPEKLFQR
jgi:hypothetical protein